ncbi:DUF2142 domain-containing protein [Nocardioides pinisoli]|uniref:DUF2142 domain-containing protein n=1 Tax=Nocardioides pinisoli TaxID=2950279 RepID=A0ABT1KXR7_9ACTN|nr:DUF2142 domain-containing protein [Nocardioides pinisoli]MCP3422552.1 DUF2142 domain-containing protein [Nocardioides pinisoli]
MSRGNHGATPATTRTPSRPSARTVAAWLATCLAAFVALAGWSLASPVASSPDDDYHLASIWCAQGLDADRCAPVEGEPDQRLLPYLASGAASCFATDFTISASCQDDFTSDAPAVATAHGNWAGAYPPYFYAALSLLVGSDVPAAVLTMRLVNSLIAVGLVAALAVLLPRPRRPLATLPLLVTAVPLSMSILTSTNPSSWSVLGAAVVWPALYVAFEETGWRRNGLAALALVGSFVGAGSRADGCLIVMMSIVLVLILRARHLRAAPLITGVGVACLLLAGTILLQSGHRAVIADSFGQLDQSLTLSQLVLMNLAQLPTLWLGIFGSGPLGRTGWLDTPFPPVVPMLTIAVWFPLLLQGSRRLFPAKVVGLALVGAALFVQPMYLLVRSGVLVGQGVQPRYLLPLIVIFTGLCLLDHRGVTARLSPAVYWTVVATLTLAHSVALHIQIRRYVTGLDVSFVRFGDDTEWWWASGPGPTATWIIASIGFAVFTAAVLRQALAAPDRPRGSARAGSGADRSSATPLRSA